MATIVGQSFPVGKHSRLYQISGIIFLESQKMSVGSVDTLLLFRKQYKPLVSAITLHKLRTHRGFRLKKKKKKNWAKNKENPRQDGNSLLHTGDVHPEKKGKLHSQSL